MRLVINLGLVQEADARQSATDFSPPIELCIHLTADESDRKAALKLVCWDATTKRTEIPDSWVVRSASGHKFPVVSSVVHAGDDDIVVLLTHWPSDPRVGVW